MKICLALVVIFLGCAPRFNTQPSGTECMPSTQTQPATLSMRELAQMEGEFRLVQIDRSARDTAPSVRRSTLQLTVADSQQRVSARERRLGNRPRELQMVGRWIWSTSAAPEQAEVSGNRLYLGCRDCLDASPDQLFVREWTERGFAGDWVNFQTGIGVAVDRRGRPRPVPGGEFCAIRAARVRD